MISEAYKLSDVINFEKEFNTILSFVSEVCEVPYVFITHLNSGNQSIHTKIGFDSITIPENILSYNQTVIERKAAFSVSSKTKHKSKTTNTSDFSFNFFSGLPLYNEENLVVGTLCITDLKPKELSPIQLKTLEHSAHQVQSMLNIWIKNFDLNRTLEQKENEFQIFIDNSKEIFYELNKNGIITYVSKNWKTFLGYEVDEVIGKSNVSFLHTDDIENVVAFLNNMVVSGENKNEITYRILHKEGHYVWHTSNIKILEKEGEVFYIGNCRDVSENILTREKIIQQKDFYEKIIDNIPTDIAVFDSNHNYLYLNPYAIKNDELRKFIVGKNDFEYAKHTGRDTIVAQKRRVKFLEAAVSKKLIVWEEKQKGLDGESFYHNRKFNPIFNEDESLDIIVGFGVDITEIKKAQEEILKSKTLLNSILENVAVGIIVQGPRSEFLEYNKAACEMLGLTEDQMLGKTSFDEHWKVIHLDGREFLAEEHPVPLAIEQLKPVKNVVMGVYRPMTNDRVWLLVDAIPVFDDLGKLLYVVCSFNNITALKKIEDELIISNERFTYSSEATSDAIWDWNILNDEIYVGGSYSLIFGHYFKNNIILDSECDTFLHPEDKESYTRNITAALENKTTFKWSDEYRYLKSDGSYAYVKDKAIILRDEEGKAIRMIGAMRDDTTNEKLKNELQQSEEQFKGAFDYSPVGMALVDIDGKYIEANDRLCEMFGYSNKEMKSLTFQEITLYEDLKIDLDHKESLDSGKIKHFSSEKRFIHKNKSIVWGHISVSLVKNSKNEIYYVVQIIDITERKKIEQQNKILTEENIKNKAILLNEAKNMYRFLAENTVDLICLLDLNTTFQYISPSVINILGYSPEEMEGKSPLDYAHPDDVEYLVESFNDFVAEKVNESTTARFRNKDGKYIWLETRANIIEKKGVKSGFQSSSRDITTRKEEEEATEKALAKERELNELRTNLVSTISHEFRTPMTTIRTSAELIAMYMEGQGFEKAQRVDKHLNTITGEIDRIIELMNSVLTISRNDAGKTNFYPIKFNLKQLCIDVIETSFDNQKDGSKVQMFFEGDNFIVFADKNLMEYTLFNLLNNAFKYSDGSGDIKLILSSISSKVVLEIIDFGIGIPEDDQQKLFNTFFRASNTNGIQGTGLGLYIVKTFTEKNSGTIQLESQLGKGTKVTLQFPLQKQ
jgi:PAS domain S-box-containing protein